MDVISIFNSIIPGLKYEYEAILCKPNKEQTAFIEYYDMNYNPMFLEYNKLNISIYREIITDGNEKTVNPVWGKIFSDYLVLLNIKIGGSIVRSEYFVVENPNLEYDGLDCLTFTCFSYEKVFLNNENLSGFKDSVKRLYDPLNTMDDDGLPNGFLNYILDKKFNGCWDLAHIDDSVLEKERILSFSGNNLKYVFDTLAESFNCVFFFDNVNMTISVYEREIGMLGENRGLVVADDNYATRITYQEDTAGVKTRVNIYGKNQATIAKYNPTGQLYVDDFSYYANERYMSRDLVDALNSFNTLAESKKGVFAGYVDRLNNGDTSVIALIEDLQNELDWKNNFTTLQIRELTPFIKEETVTINTISNESELYEYTLRHLKASSFIPVQINVDVTDIFALEEAQLDWLNVRTGDFVNIYRREFNLEYREMRLISYTHNPVKNTLSLEFSNKDTLVTMKWLNDMFLWSLENLQTTFVNNEDIYMQEPELDLDEIREELAKSMETDPDDPVVDYIMSNVISADTAMFNNVWSRYMVVEHLETNFDALDPRLPAPKNNQRNFVKAKEQEISLLCSDLSDDKDDGLENYVTPYGDQVYWLFIEDSPNAYKWFTIVDPVTIHKHDIPKGASEEEKKKIIEKLRDSYRVKVRKTIKTDRRLFIGFDENHENLIPRMIWGGGDENGNGKGFVYKEADGMYLTYTTRVPFGEKPPGTEIGVKITDEGVFYCDIDDGEWKLVGSGGSVDDLTNAISAGGENADELMAVIETKLGSGMISHLIIDRFPRISDVEGMNLKSGAKGLIIQYDPDTVIEPEPDPE